MPRNSSGVYSLPVAAYVSGTTIKSADMNTNLSDIATALTQSLATTGVSTMTAPIVGAAGTVAAPGYTFAGSLGTGFYLAAANQIGWAANGVQGATFNSDKSVTWAGAHVFNGTVTLNAATTFNAAATFTSTINLGGAGSFAASTVFVASGASHAIGTVPDPGASAGTTRFLREDATWAAPGASTVPTIQTFTSGSGNYTPTAGVTKIRVRMCAGGGGGGAQSTNNGSNGFNTTFGGWATGAGAGGAHGGASGNLGGSGGFGGASGTGNLIVRISGANGQGGSFTATANIFLSGGQGGANPFGGAGTASSGAVAGGNGIANTGGGGAGAGGQSATGSGAGGGAGEYVEFWVNNPGVIAYVVGAGGAGGVAGGQSGGNGAAGIIIIEEYYN